LVAAHPVGLGDGDGVGPGDGVGLGDGDGVEVGVGLGVGVRLGATVNNRVSGDEPLPARSIERIENAYEPALSPV
jgi:hypothetical protein